MADNFQSNPGSGGANFGSDDIGGVHYPRLKIIKGADGTNDGDISATNPLPVAASAETGSVFNGNTALVPKFAAIAASSSGNNTLVAAVTGKKIRVLALWLNSNGTVNGKLQSGAAGTDLTGLLYCVAQSGVVLPFNQAGWCETAAGALLNLNLSAAIAVGGSLVYVEV